MNVSIFDSDNILVCKAKVRSNEPKLLIIEDAQIPIKLIGKRVIAVFENDEHFQPAIKGTILAWGHGCVDRNTDKVKVASVTY